MHIYYKHISILLKYKNCFTSWLNNSKNKNARVCENILGKYLDGGFQREQRGFTFKIISFTVIFLILPSVSLYIICKKIALSILIKTWVFYFIVFSE